MAVSTGSALDGHHSLKWKGTVYRRQREENETQGGPWPGVSGRSSRPAVCVRGALSADARGRRAEALRRGPAPPPPFPGADPGARQVHGHGGLVSFPAGPQQAVRACGGPRCVPASGSRCEMGIGLSFSRRRWCLGCGSTWKAVSAILNSRRRRVEPFL